MKAGLYFLLLPKQARNPGSFQQSPYTHAWQQLELHAGLNSFRWEPVLQPQPARQIIHSSLVAKEAQKHLEDVQPAGADKESPDRK